MQEQERIDITLDHLRKLRNLTCLCRVQLLSEDAHRKDCPYVKAAREYWISKGIFSEKENERGKI